jgi:hypothetical protein
MSKASNKSSVCYMKCDILYPEDGGYTFLRNVVTTYKIHCVTTQKTTVHCKLLRVLVVIVEATAYVSVFFRFLLEPRHFLLQKDTL